MKYLVLASSLAIANMATADTDSFEYNKLEKLEVPQLENTDVLLDVKIKEGISSKASYFKLGAAPLYGVIGWGSRNFDYDHFTAKDHSLNLYLLGYFWPGLVSYKFTVLDYGKTFFNKNYFGVGFELGVGIPYPIPIPNIELVWGRQLDQRNMRNWWQIGVNLLPVALGIAIIIDGVGPEFGGLLVGLSAMSAVTLTYAF